MLIHCDLGEHLEKNSLEFQVEKGGPSNWPSNWAAYHPRGRGMLGLGAFSLPYDWPEIECQIISNPQMTKKFITATFSDYLFQGPRDSCFEMD